MCLACILSKVVCPTPLEHSPFFRNLYQQASSAGLTGLTASGNGLFPIKSKDHKQILEPRDNAIKAWKGCRGWVFGESQQMFQPKGTTTVIIMIEIIYVYMYIYILHICSNHNTMIIV